MPQRIRREALKKYSGLFAIGHDYFYVDDQGNPFIVTRENGRDSTRKVRDGEDVWLPVQKPNTITIGIPDCYLRRYQVSL